jgi:hypothetical protein
MPFVKSGLQCGINSRFFRDLGRHFQPVGWLAGPGSRLRPKPAGGHNCRARGALCLCEVRKDAALPSARPALLLDRQGRVRHRSQGTRRAAGVVAEIRKHACARKVLDAAASGAPAAPTAARRARPSADADFLGFQRPPTLNRSPYLNLQICMGHRFLIVRP